MPVQKRSNLNLTFLHKKHVSDLDLYIYSLEIYSIFYYEPFKMGTILFAKRFYLMAVSDFRISSVSCADAVSAKTNLGFLEKPHCAPVFPLKQVTGSLLRHGLESKKACRMVAGCSANTTYQDQTSSGDKSTQNRSWTLRQSADDGSIKFFREPPVCRLISVM